MKSTAGVPVDPRNLNQPVSRVIMLVLLVFWGCGEDEQSGADFDGSVPMPDQMLLADTTVEVDNGQQDADQIDAGQPADTGLARLGEDDPLPSNSFTVVDEWLSRWTCLLYTSPSPRD